MKKQIVCFGDSNTYGFEPVSWLRFPENVRWTGVLAAELGPDFAVAEEGLCGRTFAIHDPQDENNVCGLDMLPECLSAHQPIDLLTIMLGTNDVKQRFLFSAEQIGKALEQMIHQAKQAPVWGTNGVQILVISPPQIRETYKNGAFAESMGPDCMKKCAELPRIFQETAEREGCYFFDAASVAQCCDTDGIHMDGPNHILLGKAMACQIRDILKETES